MRVGEAMSEELLIEQALLFIMEVRRKVFAWMP